MALNHVILLAFAT